MKKIIIAIIVLLTVTFSLKAIAGYVQDLAWQQKVADSSPWGDGVYRFEWFDDVCYQLTGSQGVAISCVKK